MENNEVNIAFEILLEEIEGVVNALNEEGAKAFKEGDYEKARSLIEEATRLTEFRERVKNLQKEWESLFVSKIPKAKKGKKRITYKRLPRGLRTPEDKFRIPILEALLELGGSAPMNKVLEVVERKMKGVLNEYDYKRLASEPHEIRWKNTAQWCRNTLVREGLLRADSPRGIWEISEKGRRWIK